MTQPLGVGELAPEFTLRDQHGHEHSLGRTAQRANVALVFYPFAFSGICTGELREVRDSLEDFQDEGIQVLAISCDTRHALAVWADAEGYFFPLLSDFWPHGAVARDYGVFVPTQGYAARGTFLLDRARRIRFSHVNATSEPRDFGAYRRALAQLRA